MLARVSSEHILREQQKPLILRPLARSDFKLGYMDLLSELTTVGHVTKGDFERCFACIEQNPDYFVFVIEDPESETIVGSGTLLLEHKFIHDCGFVGHIEDVVISASHRGLKLGKHLVQKLTATAEGQGCYKVILDCGKDKVPFYQKCDFLEKGSQMALYFTDDSKPLL